MEKKLKVIGMSDLLGGRLKGQWRYIAAVHSKKEFAELIGESLYYVRGYSSETGNPEEIDFAMKNPHKLIAVEPLSYRAKLYHPNERWVVLQNSNRSVTE